ncbi:MAG: DUF2436 domain-containing protein [Lachnospiraceae bacterium]|nr:DUF2436 domain-containing protein [Lachnospiraceae bacterium]
MKSRKRIISMLLVVMMLIAVLPAAVFAKETKYAENKSIQHVERVKWNTSFNGFASKLNFDFPQAEGDTYTLSGIPENVEVYVGTELATVVGGSVEVPAGSTVIVAPAAEYQINSFRVVTDAGDLGDPQVVFYAADVWADGSGYQMLLDADADTYGTVIPETGGFTSEGDASEEAYAEFEYKIPENADGSLTTTNVIVDETVALKIPAGVYDWVITNPTPDDRVWIASSNGNVPGRYDDYEFKAGYTYEFSVTLGGSNDMVTLNVTMPGEIETNFVGGAYYFVMPEADAEVICEVGPKVYYSFFDFEDEAAYADWGVVDEDGDGYGWSPYDFSEYGSSYYISESHVMISFSDSESESGGSSDDWLLTGDIKVPETDPKLSFWIMGMDPDAAAEKMSVYIAASDEEIEELADMTKLGDFISSNNWEQHYIDLSDYAGKTVFFAFRHYDSEGQYLLMLDDVEIASVADEEIPDPGIWDFEQEADLDGWTFVDSDEDGQNWYRLMNIQARSNSGIGVLTSASYASGALTPDNWAITPAVEVPDNDAELSFYYCGQDPSWASEVFAVYVGTSADIAGMTNVTEDITATGTMTNRVVDLSEYAGQTVYIAFRHYNVTDMFRLNIDDVIINGTNNEPSGITVNDHTEGTATYTVDGNKVTVTSAVPCKVGYLEGGSYVYVEAVQDGDAYTFTVTDPSVTEVDLVVMGDVDLSGEFDFFDVVTAKSMDLYPDDEITALQLFAGDVDFSDEFDFFDFLGIKAAELGKSPFDWVY